MSEIVKKVKLILKRNLSLRYPSDRTPNFWSNINDLRQKGILKFRFGKSKYTTIVSDDEKIDLYDNKVSISKMLASSKPSYTERDVIISENEFEIRCIYRSLSYI